LEFSGSNIRRISYRPFTRRFLYLDDIAVDEPGQSRVFAPTAVERAPAITLSDVGHRAEFTSLMVDGVHDLHLCASSDAFQCFPLYTYDADGGHRRDNVTDWALEQFKAHYPKAKITKKDIFHYVYAVLHHPAYREKYAANLRRELPRIPLATDFAGFAKAGEKLAALHTGYEEQKAFKLKRTEAAGVKPDWRVEKMKLSKDKTSLIYNDWLTLSGIPDAAHEYRLGNRSALEWVIDQYCVERAKADADEILSDPNRDDDEEYIVRLIGQVVTVSVETMKLVRALPALEVAASSGVTYTQADLDAAHIYVAEEPAQGG
jgi:predicted helicase